MMNTVLVNLGIDVARSIVAIGFTYLFFQSFFQHKWNTHALWKVLVFAAFVFVHAAIFPISFISPDNYLAVFIILPVMPLAIGLTYFRGKPAIIAIVATLYPIIALTVDFVIAYIMLLLPFDIRGPFSSFIITGLLMLAVIFAIRKFNLGRMDFITFRLGAIFYMLISVSALISIRFINIFQNYDLSGVAPVHWHSVLGTNIFVLILIESLIRQNEKSRLLILQKSQNMIQQNHITQLADSLAEKRLMFHDFRHSIEMVTTLFNTGKENELEAYLSEISSNKSIALTLDTGNVMVDAILTSKKAEAVKNNIDFNLKMDIPQGFPNMSVEICTLMSNALENAIEACLRSTESGRFINVEIKAVKTQFLFRTVNTIGTTPKPDGKFLATSKADKINHGIGLRSMKQTCDNLRGDLNFEYDDTQFELQAYLPMNVD